MGLPQTPDYLGERFSVQTGLLLMGFGLRAFPGQKAPRTLIPPPT